jgi:hypothetical protein
MIVLCSVLFTAFSGSAVAPAEVPAVASEPTQAVVTTPPPSAFSRGPTFGIGVPAVGGMTILSERRSALTLGFSFEGGYLFAVRSRPHLRVWLGASWLREMHFLLGDRSGRFEWLTKMRLGGAWGRTFAYALVGVGPSIWRVRDDEGRRKTVAPAGSVGAGILWALGGRTSLGVEADVGASARSLSDAQVRWSARLMLMHRFGCSKAHERR